ncbi:MAG: hypothetical protein KDM91_23110, partial [Verrucomicrobiae bacterium]|nr:hypothetical protein [Verrucomicrobiae bacterium]
ELEIESIFALANREELIGWFATEDLEKANFATLNAAYSRLASLSLTDAISIWTDRLRRTGKSVGADGLVRAWAGTDPTAAENWVLGLSDEDAKRIALFALLDAVVETAPEVVERHLFEIGSGDNSNPFGSIELATRLSRNLPIDRLSALADRFLSRTEGNWEYQPQLIALLDVWGEREGDTMMRWLLAQPKERFQDHVLPHVVEARAKKNPGAFLREIESSLAGNDTFGDMAGQAWVQWVAQDGGDEAMRWYQAHGSHLIMSSESLWRMPDLSAESSNRALSLIAQLPDGKTKTEAGRAILNQLSRSDPRSALLHAKDWLPPGSTTDSFFSSTLGYLARDGDPSEALSWALDHLENGEGKDNALRYVISTWAHSNPHEAADKSKDLPEALRHETGKAIASVWVRSAPEQLLDYLNDGSNVTSATPLARETFYHFGYERSGESFLSHALALPSQAMREQAIEGLFSGWSRANLESSARALDTMKKGPLRDIALKQFVENAGQTDREAAITWSFEIGDPAKRRATVLDQGKRWLNADRAAATQWIEANETLPPEWKAELLKAGK